MPQDNVIKLIQPRMFDDQLTEILQRRCATGCGPRDQVCVDTAAFITPDSVMNKDLCQGLQ